MEDHGQVRSRPAPRPLPPACRLVSRGSISLRAAGRLASRKPPVDPLLPASLSLGLSLLFQLYDGPLLCLSELTPRQVRSLDKTVARLWSDMHEDTRFRRSSP